MAHITGEQKELGVASNYFRPGELRCCSSSLCLRFATFLVGQLQDGAKNMDGAYGRKGDIQPRIQSSPHEANGIHATSRIIGHKMHGKGGM